MRRRTYDEVKKIVNDFGYKLLDYYKKEGKKESRITIKDDYGYFYDIEFITFNKKKGNISFINKNKLFVLDNIYLWLRLNRKDFKLIGKNKYISAISNNLIFCHKKCRESFNMSWRDIYNWKGCPICSGHRVGKTTSLEYLRPNLLKEWSPKNNISPKNVTVGSHKRVFWICKVCGYGLNNEWETSVKDRCGKERGCPACSNNVVTNKNRLSILYPEISKEWHSTKNGNLTPKDVSYASHKKVWWKCCNNHIWNAAISSRTSGSGCRQCKGSSGEDEIEKILNNNSVLYEKEYIFKECRNILPLLFDFYLPKYNFCIEYQGNHHFEPIRFSYSITKEKAIKNFKEQKYRDKIKVKYCKDNNINFLRIPYWEFDNIENILNEKVLERGGNFA